VRASSLVCYRNSRWLPAQNNTPACRPCSRVVKSHPGGAGWSTQRRRPLRSFRQAFAAAQTAFFDSASALANADQRKHECATLEHLLLALPAAYLLLGLERAGGTLVAQINMERGPIERQCCRNRIAQRIGADRERIIDNCRPALTTCTPFPDQELFARSSVRDLRAVVACRGASAPRYLTCSMKARSLGKA
jgi:hypothetical protein